MPYAIHLDLADRGAARLAIVTGCEAANASGDAGEAPHISLAVYDDSFSPDTHLPAIKGFAERLEPLDVDFQSLGIFPGPGSVLFAAPIVSNALLALHANFHRALESARPCCWAHYLPGHWVPHATLATGLSPKDLARRTLAAAAGWEPLLIPLDAIRLVEFSPVKTLWNAKL
jgi:2'-5' RNA ligase